MISFIAYKNAREQIEISADDQGIDDLIFYLEGIKKGKDHMHLVIDSEIDSYPISRENEKNIIIIKQVRLQYENSSEWNIL